MILGVPILKHFRVVVCILQMSSSVSNWRLIKEDTLTGFRNYPINQTNANIILNYNNSCISFIHFYDSTHFLFQNSKTECLSVTGKMATLCNFYKKGFYGSGTSRPITNSAHNTLGPYCLIEYIECVK